MFLFSFWSSKMILFSVSSVMSFYIFSFSKYYLYRNCYVFIAEWVPQMVIYTNTILTRSAFLVFFYFNNEQLLLCYDKYIVGRPHPLAFIIWTSPMTLVNTLPSFWSLRGRPWGEEGLRTGDTKSGQPLQRRFPGKERKEIMGHFCLF